MCPSMVPVYKPQVPGIGALGVACAVIIENGADVESIDELETVRGSVGGLGGGQLAGVQLKH
jgi:hypothetical protein